MANTKVTSNVISDDIALGGNPTTTTQSAGNNTTRIATTAFVKAAIDATIDSAPGALDTLNELAAAIGDDANFSTTVTNSIATKLPLAGGTMTGALIVVDGSTSAPSIGNSGDTNTGIYFPADDQLGLVVGGSRKLLASSTGIAVNNGDLVVDTDKLFVDISAGKVGIGTASPTKALEVSSGGSDVTTIKASYNATNYLELAHNRINAVSSGGNDSIQLQTGGTTGLTIDVNQKVGIGTTSPSGKLDIHTVDTSAYSSTGEPVETALIHNESGSDGTGATYYSSLALTVVDGATSQGFINYVRTADNQGKFTFSQRTGSSSYAEALTILNDGNVGIGNTSPSHKLDVTGTIRAYASGSGNAWLYTQNDNKNYLVGVRGSSSNAFSIYDLTEDHSRFRVNSDGGIAIGEDNLGYAGQILSVKAGTGNTVLYGESTDATCQISLRDNSSSQNIQYAAVGNHHVFTKDTTEYMRIDSSGDLLVGTTSTASNSILNVAGGIRFNSYTVSHGLNVVSSQSFTNSDVANSCGSVYYKCFIVNIYHNNGSSQVFGIANGGGGVGYNFTVMRPDSASLLHGQGVSFALTTIGSSPMTFTVAISSGGGALTVERTSGSGTYYVSVQNLGGA